MNTATVLRWEREDWFWICFWASVTWLYVFFFSFSLRWEMVNWSLSVLLSFPWLSLLLYSYSHWHKKTAAKRVVRVLSQADSLSDMILKYSTALIGSFLLSAYSVLFIQSTRDWLQPFHKTGLPNVFSSFSVPKKSCASLRQRLLYCYVVTVELIISFYLHFFVL